jgi:transforming growth factor-beta-induced protein
MKNLKIYAVAFAMAALTITSCSKEDEKKPTTPPAPVQKTIAQIASGDTTFSILVAALNKTNLTATLNGAGTFTVFAPTNKAFRDLGLSVAAINAISDSADIEDLKDILMYHVLGTEVKSTQLSNAYVPTLFAVNNNGVSLKVSIAPVKLNKTTNVTAADIDASNGILHVIDEVLTPPSVVDIASMEDNLSTLVSAAVKADLVETLDDAENVTVFAPANKAFADIKFDLEGTSKEALAPILTAHVLGSQVRSSQIKNGDKATTLNAKVELTFNTTSGVKVSGGKTVDANVTTADLQAYNGVIHLVDKVILP